jgi:cyclic beta-1,2-glucan synthetase
MTNPAMNAPKNPAVPADESAPWWRTGAAGWFYRAGVESLLGLQVRAGQLDFNPCIPKDWSGYHLTYRHGQTRYQITVENPDGVAHGIRILELDGVVQPDRRGIKLADDGQAHRVRIVMGE